MFTLKRLSRFIFLGLALHLSAINHGYAATLSGCRWSGQSVEWVLARHLPAADISGSLGSEIVPYLNANGIPVSFLSMTPGDSRIQLVVSPTTTTREILLEIVRQAPQYRYSSVDGKIVIYPKGDAYDAVVDLGQIRSATRAAAFFFVLGGLKGKSTVLHGLDLTYAGGWLGWGKSPYADTIMVGGSRSAIEHLASLVQGRPSQVFRVLAKGEVLFFRFASAGLIKKLTLHVPSTVRIGEAFDPEVLGTLEDGTLVSLLGSECQVSYGVTNSEVLEIDDLGRAIGRRKGAVKIIAEYEHHEASARVEVE